MTLLAEHGRHNQLAHGRKGSVSGDTARQGGGSFAADGSPIRTGAVVAVPGHSMAVDAQKWDTDRSYRKAAIKEWGRNNAGSAFGTWDTRGEGGTTIVFDRIQNVSRSEAIRLGKERGEDGVFDLDAMEYIPTGGKTYTEATMGHRTLLGAFEAPPKDMTEDELDAWAEGVLNTLDERPVEADLAERAFVRHPKGSTKGGQFASTGGRGTGGPLKDSQERNMVGGAYTAERTALHDSIIANAQSGVPVTPGEQVAILTGGGAASGKTTQLMPALRENGLAPAKGDAVDVNADDIKEQLPDYQANVAAGKVYAARDSHEESSDISKRMYADSLRSGRSTVYDSVGDNGAASVQKKVAQMRASGARRVDGHYVTKHPDLAVAGAKARAKQTGRDVAEAEIRRQHRDVSKTWVDLAQSKTFDSLTLWDTNRDGPAKLIASATDGNIDVFDRNAFEQFLSYGQ